MTVMQYKVRRFYTDGHNAHGDGFRMISLPAIPGVSMAPDRAETAPTLPTIREPRAGRVQGAALAAQDARKVDDLAALICGYRAAMMPAVTVAMERAVE